MLKLLAEVYTKIITRENIWFMGKEKGVHQNY